MTNRHRARRPSRGAYDATARRLAAGTLRSPLTVSCGSRREGDEVTCPACGLRWENANDRPPCPKR